MKRFSLAFALLVGLSFLFSQCGSADEAEKFSDQFFTLIVKQEFEKAAEMMDRPLGDTTNFALQLQAFQNNPTNGQLLSFKKSMGFNTSISNGIKTVKLPYVLKYDKGNRSFEVTIINRGGGYKIVSVQ